MMDFLREDWRLVRLALMNPATWVWWLAGGLWAWAFAGENLAIFWPLLGFTGLMAVVAMADLETRLLPLLPLALVGLGGLLLHPLPQPAWMPWAGALLAGGGLFLVGWLSGILAGRKALGGGDIWLATALGAWLGLVGLLPWLAAVAALGVLAVLARRLAGKAGAMPFAPILIAAAWLALLHGDVYYAVVLP